MRAKYLRVLEAAMDRDPQLTQAKIAAAGGLPAQNSYVSKIKTTKMEPRAENFIRLIAGLGMPVSDFFAELEGRALHVREQEGDSGTPLSSEPLDRDLDTKAIVNAVIETLLRGVAAPARTARPRRRKRG